jgi:hypothetical protein
MKFTQYGLNNASEMAKCPYSVVDPSSISQCQRDVSEYQPHSIPRQLNSIASQVFKEFKFKKLFFLF